MYCIITYLLHAHTLSYSLTLTPEYAVDKCVTSGLQICSGYLAVFQRFGKHMAQKQLSIIEGSWHGLLKSFCESLPINRFEKRDVSCFKFIGNLVRENQRLLMHALQMMWNCLRWQESSIYSTRRPLLAFFKLAWLSCAACCPHGESQAKCINWQC